MQTVKRELTPVHIDAERTIFNSTQVRFFTDENGDLWIPQQDLEEVLKVKNLTPNVRKYVADSAKGVINIITPGGQQHLVVLHENAVYKLVMRADMKGKPFIKRFQDWVCDVIRTIRKTGRYELKKQLDPREERYATRKEILDQADVMIALRAKAGLDDRDRMMLMDALRDQIPGRKAIGGGSESSGISISRYIEENFGRLPAKRMRALCIRSGKLAADAYRAKYGENPPKREQHVDGTTRLVSHYTEQHFKEFIHEIIDRELRK